MRFSRFLFVCAIAAACTTACAATSPPIQPVAHVDLPRFMGKWYVIAAIPTRFEKNAYNAVETYALQADGRVQTTYRYRPGGFDAPPRSIHSVGYVQPGTGNAVWGVQFFWPFKTEYIIAYLDDSYSETIIARNKRDYVWIMARTPNIPQAAYQALLARVARLGYPLSAIAKVPQRWPADGGWTPANPAGG